MSASLIPQVDPHSARATLTIALAGNPNCGKTTIFNALTGLRQKVANYPGVTVEKKTGYTTLPGGRRATVIDLPGTYSLVSRSPDERVAMEVLRGLRAGTPAPDVVMVVVDASNLQRNLYLVSQLLELGLPMVVALNMTDVAKRRGIHVSADRLSNLLGVPCVPVVGHKRDGIDELKHAVPRAAVGRLPDLELPELMREEMRRIGETLKALDDDSSRLAGSPVTLGPETKGSQVTPLNGEKTQSDLRHQAIAERLLIGDLAPDIGAFSDEKQVQTQVEQARERLTQADIDPVQADIEAHYRWIDQVAAGALVPACEVLLPSANRSSGVSPVPSGI